MKKFNLNSIFVFWCVKYYELPHYKVKTTNLEYVIWILPSKYENQRSTQTFKLLRWISRIHENVKLWFASNFVYYDIWPAIRFEILQKKTWNFSVSRAKFEMEIQWNLKSPCKIRSQNWSLKVTPIFRTCHIGNYLAIYPYFDRNAFILTKWANEIAVDSSCMFLVFTFPQHFTWWYDISLTKISTRYFPIEIRHWIWIFLTEERIICMIWRIKFVLLLASDICCILLLTSLTTLAINPMPMLNLFEIAFAQFRIIQIFSLVLQY